MTMVVTAQSIIEARNSIRSSLNKIDSLSKISMFVRMLCTALDSPQSEFGVSCQRNGSVIKMKYGRFVLDYSGFPSNSITLSLFSLPETLISLGTFKFPDGTIEDASSSLNSIDNDYSQDDSGVFMMHTGVVGLMLLRCLSVLSEYELPRGCWVPQFEDGAIEWLDNFGASKPEFIPLDNSLVKKQAQLVKQTSSAVNDDISL